VIFILDTDICIYALRAHPAVVERLRQHSPDEIAVTAVTEAELEFGALKSRDPVRNRAAVAHLLGPVARLPFDSEAAMHHAAIRYALRSAPIGERDTIIASVAVARGATLVSNNESEFRRVPGLRLENWVGTWRSGPRQ
jgi:tRNA(fMet)-specific endonuclease VapC